MSQYKSLAEDAADIATRASKIALSYFRQPILIETKDNGTPVTLADKKTEEAIRNDLSKAFPDFGILGEEFGEEQKKSDFVWTVDPIDGTRSFIKGIPLFGTLLGLLEKGKPVVGVLVLPALGETYYAAKGFGTHCGKEQVRVSATTALENAMVSGGDMPTFRASHKMKYLQTLMQKTDSVRGYTDCFGHSLVLRGAIDAMIDPVVSIWDVAPIACLVTEAGGEYFNFEGTQDLTSSSFISCTAGLKRQLLGL